LYFLVWDFIARADNPVDRVQIRDHLGYSSTSAIHKTLHALVQDGFVKQDKFVRPNGTVKYFYTSDVIPDSD